MYSTLSHYDPSFTTSSDAEWDGQRSRKFPKAIRHLPARDLIQKSNL